MTDFRALEDLLSATLNLTRRPVGVAFLDAPVPGVRAFIGTRPSGCSFWPLAADGRTFYTVPADHYNCPIGSHTHNMPLPPAREAELGQMLSLMSDIGYLRMEEVPAIPQIDRAPGAVVYAPLGETPVDPDVVILTGTPASLMLLQEAAAAREIAVHPMMGRPTCMALPAARAGGLYMSVGCVGNRVYTELTDGELYAVMGRDDLPALVEALDTIAAANRQLAEFHTARRAELTT